MELQRRTLSERQIKRYSKNGILEAMQREVDIENEIHDLTSEIMNSNKITQKQVDEVKHSLIRNGVVCKNPKEFIAYNTAYKIIKEKYKH
jgi:hypothetical protein